ncbi:MAG: hypothetical protein AAF694_30625 [Bacteroidota bacterium]
MSDKSLLAHLYNPHQLSKDALNEGFIVRGVKFRKLYREISESMMIYPEQHYLIVGQRGMGKTTLLLRLSYEIESDPKLNSWLVPIVFTEEVYGVQHLYSLWELGAQYLEEKRPEYGGIYDQMVQHYQGDIEAYENKSFQVLIEALRRNGHKLILFIDNFGDIFGKFSEKEGHRLREILLTNADIRLVGASSSVLESFFRYDQPFYEFFKIERLEGLSQAETLELLHTLADNYKEERVAEILDKHPGRIEAVRRLTGGVIRTIILLFEIFADEQEGNAFSDLEQILDRVTPLYKHRMDELPSSQQQILDAMARNWDAMDAAQILNKTRLSEDMVNADLRLLHKNDLIERFDTGKGNILYQVKERFFNIWYLMRYGRKHDKNRVVWLVRFLEEWCNEQELEDRVNQHRQALEEDRYEEADHAFVIGEALSQHRLLSAKLQDELVKDTRSFLKRRNPSLAAALTFSDFELQEEGITHYTHDDYKKALELLLPMKEKDARILFRIAYAYEALQDWVHAESYYKQAIEQGDIAAMHSLGLLYGGEKGNFQEARKYFRMAADEGHTDAMFHLALLYEKGLKDLDQAEKFYRQAGEAGDAEAWLRLGHIQVLHHDNWELAEGHYLEAASLNEPLAAQVLARHYNQVNHKRKEALYFAKLAYQVAPGAGTAHTLSVIYAKENAPEKALLLCLEFLLDEKFTRAHPDLLVEPFIHLLAQGQYVQVYKFFEEGPGANLHLKDRFKPLWFAILFFLRDSYPEGYISMGSELKETVEEIVGQVKRLKEMQG